MQMCAFAVYACSGVTHHRDRLTAPHRLTGLHCERAEMCVQTVVARAAPPMLNSHVFAVVWRAGNGTDMHNLAIGNSAHFVLRLAICIAVHGSDINSFVKPGINDASPSAFRITDKTILPAFPWCRFRAVIISVDRLVKSGAIS